MIDEKYAKYQARIDDIKRLLNDGQIKLAATLARVLASDMTKEAQA